MKPFQTAASAAMILLVVGLAASQPLSAAPPSPPNFLIVLTDDVGWGDYACYNPQSKIAAPHVERLAREGMRFTHAHTPAALCAPTRYSILTGNHPWRGRAPGGTWGFHVPSQILPGQKTVANLLQEAGYHTAMFGKQGFGGLHAQLPDGNPDFTRPMVEGPRAWGFAYSAIIPRGHQALPLLFLVNELPEVGAEKLLVGPLEQRGVRVDYREPQWDHSRVGERLLDHAQRFLQLHRSRQPGRPFFMHFCTDGGHAPYVPADAIRGTPLKGQTRMNEHTDMVLEPDILLGKLMEMLQEMGQLENTVICFTSDNGGLPYERNFGHDAVGGLRGKKAFLFEGGHRVPLLVRWPGKIAAGAVRDQFVCTHDLVPTLVELAGAAVPADQCLDAVSLAPVLLGHRDDSRPVRRAMLIESSPGRDAGHDGGFTDGSVVITREMNTEGKPKPVAKPAARRPAGEAAPGEGKPAARAKAAGSDAASSESKPAARAKAAGDEAASGTGKPAARAKAAGSETASSESRPAARAKPAGKAKAGKIRAREAETLPSQGIGHALYEGDFKLMVDIANDAPSALYDLKNDRGEQRNLLGDPAQAERVQRMEATYRAIRASKRSVEIIAAPAG